MASVDMISIAVLIIFTATIINAIDTKDLQTVDITAHKNVKENHLKEILVKLPLTVVPIQNIPKEDPPDQKATKEYIFHAPKYFKTNTYDPDIQESHEAKSFDHSVFKRSSGQYREPGWDEAMNPDLGRPIQYGPDSGTLLPVHSQKNQKIQKFIRYFHKEIRRLMGQYDKFLKWLKSPRSYDEDAASYQSPAYPSTGYPSTGYPQKPYSGSSSHYDGMNGMFQPSGHF